MHNGTPVRFDDKLFVSPAGFDSDFAFYRSSGDRSEFIAKQAIPLRPISAPFDEAVRTARKICRLANGKPTLCLSSGVDSQCMLQAFQACGLPFDVAVLTFKDQLNQHDVSFIKQVLDQGAVKYSCVELDAIRFFESGDFFSYGREYQCQSPQLAAHLWMLDQIDGAPILSGNFLMPVVGEGGIFWIGLPGDLHTAYHRYLIKNDRAGEPWFFLNSSELAASFLHQDCLSKFRRLLVNFETELDDYAYKCDAYTEGGFKVNRQPTKQTGFELLREYFDKKLGTQYGNGFDALFRLPLEAINPPPAQYTQLVPAEFLKTDLELNHGAFQDLIKFIKRLLNP